MRPVNELDAATKALAIDLGRVKTVSLKNFNKLLHDNLCNIGDTVLELDVLASQLEGYITLVNDPDFATAVEEAKNCNTAMYTFSRRMGRKTG